MIYSGNFPGLILNWLMHFFYLYFILLFLGAAHYLDYISDLLSRNSYLDIDKYDNSLIYILSVSHWACWQQIQFSMITVVDNSMRRDDNTFNHKEELMTCSGCLEMHLHVDLSHPEIMQNIRSNRRYMESMNSTSKMRLCWVLYYCYYFKCMCKVMQLVCPFVYLKERCINIYIKLRNSTIFYK